MNVKPSDQLLRNARREALFVVTLWFLALLWTMGYCYLNGYQHSPNSLVVQHGWAAERPAAAQAWLGLPDWVLYGIVAPWILCSLITAAFCLVGMKDDNLGSVAGEGADHGH